MMRRLSIPRTLGHVRLVPHVLPFAAFALSIGSWHCGGSSSSQVETTSATLRADEARAAAEAAAQNRLMVAAESAYAYGYPLVLMDATKRDMTNVPAASPVGAPINQFQHARNLGDVDVRSPIPQSDDTLDSSAWLDLSKEPIVLHVPDTKGRYFFLQAMDGWSNVFSAFDSRSRREDASYEVALTAPGWKGTLPQGMARLEAPTQMVWLLGRLRVNDANDLAAARTMQSELTLVPLSAHGKPYPPPSNAAYDFNAVIKDSPREVVAKMDGNTFFRRMASLMPQNPPAPADARMAPNLAAIGMSPDGRFAPPPALERVLAKVPERALGRIHAEVSKLGRVENGWTMLRRDPGIATNYERRAAAAMTMEMPSPSDFTMDPITAVDANGSPLTGDHRYVIRFAPGSIPPVHAYWSLTLYDEHGRLAKDVGRHAIHDIDPVRRNADGSFDVIVQKDRPAGDTTNWLPSPQGRFRLMLCLQAPKDEVQRGAWKPPAVRRLAGP